MIREALALAGAQADKAAVLVGAPVAPVVPTPAASARRMLRNWPTVRRRLKNVNHRDTDACWTPTFSSSRL